MSLITCPECGREISDKASSCPGCGCPSSEWRSAARTPVPQPAPSAGLQQDPAPLPKQMPLKLSDLVSPDVVFNCARKGYSMADTDALIDAIFAEDSTLTASQVSKWTLGEQRKGYDMGQVDAYLDSVVSALTDLGRV